MEDYAGNSLEKRLEQIVDRRKITVNGKSFALPRNLAERIFYRREKDLRSTRILYKDNGEIWVSYCNCYRYKPTALSSLLSSFISNRYVEDFAGQLPPFEGKSRDSLDDSKVLDVALAECSDLQNRGAFQAKLVRQFYQKSKF